MTHLKDTNVTIKMLLSIFRRWSSLFPGSFSCFIRCHGFELRRDPGDEDVTSPSPDHDLDNFLLILVSEKI